MAEYHYEGTEELSAAEFEKLVAELYNPNTPADRKEELTKLIKIRRIGR